MRATYIRQRASSPLSDAEDVEDTAITLDIDASFEEERLPNCQDKHNELQVVPDANFYAADEEMDKWAEDFPQRAGGIYPRLLLIDPNDGKGKASRIPTTRSSKSSTTTRKPFPFFSLPLEIRCMVYAQCISDVGYSRSEVVGLSDRDEYMREMIAGEDTAHLRYVYLESRDGDLKDLLLSPVLRISRLLRAEALTEFFRNTCFVTAWLPSVARFTKFLGAGKGLVRYLSICDIFDHKTQDPKTYQSALHHITKFPSLRHLKITLMPTFDLNGQFPDWAFASAGDHWREIDKPHTTAKMIMHWGLLAPNWPEYSTLSKIRAQDFSMQIWPAQFDCRRGAMGILIEKMRANFQATNTTKQGGQKRVVVFIDRPGPMHRHRESAPSPEAIDLTMPECFIDKKDQLDTKMFPLYNFLREFLAVHAPHIETAYFPFALKSDGEAHQDCALCYLSNNEHCGYHNIPRYHVDENYAFVFEKMDYTDLVRIMKSAIHHMEVVERERFHDAMIQIAAVQMHLGWQVDTHDWMLRGGTDTRGMAEDFGLYVWDVVGRELCIKYGPEARDWRRGVYY